MTVLIRSANPKLIRFSNEYIEVVSGANKESKFGYDQLGVRHSEISARGKVKKVALSGDGTPLAMCVRHRSTRRIQGTSRWLVSAHHSASGFAPQGFGWITPKLYVIHGVK